MSLVEVAGVVVKEIGASLGSGLIPAFLVGLVVAGLVMVAQDPGERPGFKKGIETLLTDKRHVRLILLAGYCYLLLDRTIFSREMEWGGLKYVMNDWWFYYSKGELNCNWLLNLILFIPYGYLLVLAVPGLFDRQDIRAVSRVSLKYALVTSLVIEVTQLVFQVGTFQLADLWYNSLGGLLGGLLYWFLSHYHKQE